MASCDVVGERAGHAVLEARCQQVAGKSVLVDRYHRIPLKITKTFREPHTAALMLYIMDVSPGMMEGDHYDIQICQEADTHLIVTNQSFTKVHPSAERGSVMQAEFHIGEGAVLEYMPEPTIPYAGSRFQGQNRFHLDKGASLLFAEITTPGRTHRGERFQYARYATVTEVYLEGDLVACDRFLLEPKRQPYARMGVLESYTHQAVMYIFAPQANESLLQVLRDLLAEADAQSVLAAVSLADRGGMTVRMLGVSVWELQALCQRVWTACRQHLWQYGPCILRK